MLKNVTRLPEHRLPQLIVVLLLLRLGACSQEDDPRQDRGTSTAGTAGSTGAGTGAQASDASVPMGPASGGGGSTTSGGLPWMQGTGGSTSGGLPWMQPPDTDVDAGD